MRDFGDPVSYAEAKGQLWAEMSAAYTPVVNEFHAQIKEAIYNVIQDPEKHVVRAVNLMRDASKMYVALSSQMYALYINKLSRAYVKFALKEAGLDAETIMGMYNRKFDTPEPKKTKGGKGARGKGGKQ